MTAVTNASDYAVYTNDLPASVNFDTYLLILFQSLKETVPNNKIPNLR